MLKEDRQLDGEIEYYRQLWCWLNQKPHASLLFEYMSGPRIVGDGKGWYEEVFGRLVSIGAMLFLTLDCKVADKINDNQFYRTLRKSLRENVTVSK